MKRCARLRAEPERPAVSVSRRRVECLGKPPSTRDTDPILDLCAALRDRGER